MSKDLDDTAGSGDALTEQQKELERAIKGVEISLERSARAYYDQVKAVEDELALQLQLTGATQQQKTEAEALKRAETAYLQERRRINDAIADAERSQKAEEKAGITLLQKQLSDLDKSYQQHGKNIEKLMDAQYKNSRRFSTGWKTAFNQYVDDATNAATQAQRIFQSVTQNLEDALFQFFTTGKLGWKDFANNVIQEMIRIQTRQLAANLLSGGGGGGGKAGGGGGLFGGSIIPGFLASGGPANANKPYIVGERGPELFVPRSTGTVVPNDQLGMGGGASVTYNINAVDAMSFKQMIAQDPSFLYAVSEQGRRRLPGGR
jgi:lambda family phage tail tape measure protein